MTPRYAAFTHPGGRRLNEDAMAVADGVWVVCDGVGGHPAGEVASMKVADFLIARFLETSDFTVDSMRSAVEAAQVVFATDESGMRTTMVLAWIRERSLRLMHIGDSRAYVIRDGNVLHITQDHSVVAALHAAGEIGSHEIRSHPNRNRITRSLGRDEKGEAVISEEPIALREGDAILLCTDGLWEYVQDSEIVFDRVKTDDPAEWIRLLVRRAFSRAPSDHDNLTAVAILV